ncbi:MAG: hypothetical protein WAW80_04100 [Candidatus Saccharimonadales bacterium]
MSELKTPSNDEVVLALRKIPTLQLRRIFYAGNKNPNWLKPLDEAGAFKSPPEPIVDEDGLIRELYWPELDYLSNMAEIIPGDVVDVLLRLNKSKNSWIKRAVFEIGSTIPASEAAKLVPMILGWKKDGLGFRTDPRNQVLLVKNLLQGGKEKAGRKLADFLFKPYKVEGYKKVDSLLEEYWYADLLPSVIDSFGPNGLQDVVMWLTEYEKHNEHLTDKFDITYIARSVIEDAGESKQTVEHALIDAAIQIATRDFIANPTFTATFLLRQEIFLIRRIALHSLKVSIDTIIKSGANTDSLIAEAKRLIGDPFSTDSICRVEYAELVKQILSISPEALNILEKVIEAGPYGSEQAYREKLKNDKEEGSTVDEKLVTRTREWRHKLLAAIGADALSGNLLSMLKVMDDELGEIANPLTPMISFGGSWVGPTSPIKVVDFLSKSPEEIIGHLVNWKPTDSWKSPTHEGQGRELTSVVSTNPKVIAGVDKLIERLRPTYIRAIIQGWSAAIKTDIVPDWNQVIETVGDTLKEGVDSRFVQEGRDFDDDPNYVAAKQAAVGLLEDLIRRHKKLKIPDSVMSEAANLLLTVDTEDAWKEYVEASSESNMDPLTVSINWQWPMRIRAIILLLTLGKSTEWHDLALEVLDKELRRQDNIGASRAVVGERLGNLSFYEPDWLEKNLASLVGTYESVNEHQQIVVTTAMATSSYYNDCFDLIRGPLAYLVKDISKVKAGWNGRYEPEVLIGAWIINAFVWGHIQKDDPLFQSYFSDVPADDRGNAIGHIAWAIMQAEKADAEFVRRFGELWDLRVAHIKSNPDEKEEIKDFYWFVRSGKYPIEWWLPRLIEAAEIHGELKTHGMIGEILADASATHPNQTLHALRLLLTEKPDTDMLNYDLREHAAPIVIASALRSNDETLKREATEFMHDLGSWGYIDLKERVNKILAQDQE